MSSTPSGQLELLAAALGQADLRVLLMVLVHQTGDLAWLEPPFVPQRDVRLVPAVDAGLPGEVQQRIRAAALEALSSGQPPRLVDPGNALMQRMMSVCLGEAVPAEYAELTREEMGLKSRFVEWHKPPPAPQLEDSHVLIVGAGVCGIALGVSLKKLGVPFTIVERNADVGGTWFRNRYPGCGVDTPNHAYSYSFGPRHPWSRYFSRREEVFAYLAKVVDKFGLRAHIRFNTQVESARWNEDSSSWHARVRGPGGASQLCTRFFVGATGQLSDPSIPPIEGAADFDGRIFHSVDWPQDLDVAGRRVAVIGTGATAMQIVPAISGTAAQVAVFQRTAQWARAIPGYSDVISDGVQYLLAHVPMYAEWFRFNMFWRYGDGLLRHLRIDPSWPHPQRAVSKINDRHREEMTEFIVSELEGRPDLLEKCIPDYPAYGKRILLDNNWFKTLRKENVQLLTEGIRRITPGGILLQTGRHVDADVIVYATGFKLTELAARLNITGRGGRTLAQAWANDDPAAYLGLMVPGFPNFYCMLGPGSGPGHGGSAVFQAESQARFVSACIVQMVEEGIGAIEIKQSEHDSYMQKADAEHAALIWSHPKVSTYYKNRHGRVFSVMPWRFVDYWKMTHDPRLEAFITVPAESRTTA